jgi:hypothetical protein
MKTKADSRAANYTTCIKAGKKVVIKECEFALHTYNGVDYYFPYVEPIEPIVRQNIKGEIVTRRNWKIPFLHFAPFKKPISEQVKNTFMYGFRFKFDEFNRIQNAEIHRCKVQTDKGINFEDVFRSLCIQFWDVDKDKLIEIIRRFDPKIDILECF